MPPFNVPWTITRRATLICRLMSSSLTLAGLTLLALAKVMQVNFHLLIRKRQAFQLHLTPLSEVKPLPSTGSPQALSPPPIDVTALNNSPAPVAMPAVETVPDPAHPTQTLPAVTPTIAETGIPVPSGPSSGPSSGSLLDIRGQGSAPSVTPAVPGQKYESATEEKKRLAAAYSQQASTEVVAPAAQGPSQATPTLQSESAEEEKKRLEREERERILLGDPNPTSKGDDEDLPPYTEPSL